MFSDDEIGGAWSAHRPYLIDLAFRMLGDIGAAEDVVQEAFFRLVQTPVGTVNDARGWLIVVTSRLCLDHIKSAPWRRERPADMTVRDYRDADTSSVDPADRVTLDDDVRLALLVVLECLTPAERVAYVLHDVFQLPFDVIAQTVGRPSTACRQLASRARRKVRESRDTGPADGAHYCTAAHSITPSMHSEIRRASYPSQAAASDFSMQTDSSTSKLDRSWLKVASSSINFGERRTAPTPTTNRSVSGFVTVPVFWSQSNPS